MSNHTTPTTTTTATWVDHMMGGYTEAELKLAFDCVHDLHDWKAPIDVTVGTSVRSVTRDQIATAIAFYTGGHATITDNADGSYRVQADGYRAVCA